MEQGLIDTDENDHAPVFNSVGIGVVETIHQRLAHKDFVAFVETWPPAMREQALAYKTPWGEDFLEDDPDTFQISFRWRLRWTLRHPIRTRLGTRISFAR
ncbi:MAG: hypothetical protein JWP10_117 [Nocardioidaceae bacterium]|nr:hypothetical protein [Nocardioidaceae bacterium]